MAERFSRSDETVQAGVRRIAWTEIDAAIAVIDARQLSPAEKVHEVRKQLKALRALLRLIRPTFADYDRENLAFRDISRRLSSARDAQVLIETFDALTARPSGRAITPGQRRVRERLIAQRVEEKSAVPLLHDAREALCAARERASHWTLDKQGWDALSGGLEKTYGRARRAMRKAARSGNPAAHHDWRKQVKYHAAHAKLLRRMKSCRLKERQKGASRLADLLGDRHDIDVFLAAMAREPARFGDFVAVTQLARLARLRIARLDRQARRRGDALFGDKPEKLTRRWRGWWQDWRS